MPPPPGTPPELAIDCAAYSLSCDAGACATSFPLELPITIDLGKQPALMGMGSKVVSDITLQSLEYTITNNIGVALPAVALSVAPMRVTSAAGNVEAKMLATLPPTDAGAMVGDTILLEPEAKKAFQSFAKDLLTPFNVIASTKVALTSGSPLPKGKVDVVVSGTVTAWFSWSGGGPERVSCRPCSRGSTRTSSSPAPVPPASGRPWPWSAGGWRRRGCWCWTGPASRGPNLAVAV
jgi:hypothetical protein